MDQQSTRRAAEAMRRECEPSAIYAPHGLAEGISALAAEPIFAAILETAGPPRFRRRRNGFGTLLHIILEQQVSIDAAAKMYHRLVGLWRTLAPAAFLEFDDATLRSCGFSRQKMGYARDLAAAVERGSFDFARLAAAPDETVLADLLAIRGIGRWSAEIYLLFALGRPDIWPAADLGLQLAMAEQLGLGSRPAFSGSPICMSADASHPACRRSFMPDRPADCRPGGVSNACALPTHRTCSRRG